jgi:hypothetical protein
MCFKDEDFAGKRPTGKQITEVIEGLLRAANRYGLTTEPASPSEETGGVSFPLR